ncbi:hypothetical protein Hanom_Chr14g01258771 [Helianthus anomalus]
MSKIILSEYNLDRQRIIKETIAFDKRPGKERYISKIWTKKILERLIAFIGKDKLTCLMLIFCCIIGLVRLHLCF